MSCRIYRFPPSFAIKISNYTIMPFINIKITDGNVTKDQKEKLITGTTRLLVDVLDKDPATTHVVIEEISKDNWGVNGKLYASKNTK